MKNIAERDTFAFSRDFIYTYFSCLSCFFTILQLFFASSTVQFLEFCSFPFFIFHFERLHTCHMANGNWNWKPSNKIVIWFQWQELYVHFYGFFRVGVHFELRFLLWNDSRLLWFKYHNLIFSHLWEYIEIWSIYHRKIYHNFLFPKLSF